MTYLPALMFIDKALALARSNRDFPDRLRIKASGLLDRLSPRSRLENVSGCDQLELQLSGLLGSRPIVDGEPSLEELESSLDRQWSELKRVIPFSAAHRGTATLGRLCYAVCRRLRPSRVVETGVAYGVTSAYVLQALAANGQGELLSVDLPPLGPHAEENVGCLIPPHLRTRWNLTRGSAKKVLPRMLQEAGSIDMFVHDSLHTYSHMQWELKIALAALRPGGALIVDDIQGNRAFEEAARDSRVASWFVIRQDGKNAVCGAMRMRSL